jgi:hypothetical protein
LDLGFGISDLGFGILDLRWDYNVWKEERRQEEEGGQSKNALAPA